MTRLAVIAPFAALLLAMGTALAEEPSPVLQDRPDAPVGSSSDQAGELLGPAFRSVAAGIELSPPVGCSVVRYPTGNQVADFINNTRGWVLEVRRSILPHPTPLTTVRGVNAAGMLEQSAAAFRNDIPAARLLRQDTTTTIAEWDVGMLAFRHALGTSDRLTQIALFRFSDRIYYILKFTTPGRPPADKSDRDDPGEKQAVATFAAVLDSVRLMDRSAIRRDQEERLLRTRALFLRFTDEKIRSVLIPQQWCRIIRDTKDVGYIYTFEEIGKRDAFEGLQIGTTARSFPQEKLQVDSESWMFTTVDRAHENFSNVLRTIDTHDPKEQKLDYRTEIGVSEQVRDKVVAAPKEERELIPNKGNRWAQLVTMRVLRVKWLAKTDGGGDLVRDLPPFYLPAAIGHVLPRLLPLDRATSYLFAVYASDQRELMMRYVDVEAEANVTLAGRKVRAVPIKDRLGLEGSVTTHYLSPEGKYLGTVNEDSKIIILPSDVQTLNTLWNNPTLKRPTEVPLLK